LGRSAQDNLVRSRCYPKGGRQSPVQPGDNQINEKGKKSDLSAASIVHSQIVGGNLIRTRKVVRRPSATLNACEDCWVHPVPPLAV
jgi:hypothetical protein